MSFLRSSVWLLAALTVGCAQAPDALEASASERGGDGGPVEMDPADDPDGGLVGRDPTATTPGSLDAAVRDASSTLAPRASTDAALADAAAPVAPVVAKPVQDAATATDAAATDAAAPSQPVAPRPEPDMPVTPPATPTEPPPATPTTPTTPVTPEPTPETVTTPDAAVAPPVEQPTVDAGTSEPTPMQPVAPVAACAPGRYQGELAGDLAYAGLSVKPRITGTIALVLGQATTAGLLPVESGTVTGADALGGTLTGRVTGNLNCANGQLEGGKLTGTLNLRLVQNPIAIEGTVGAAYVANDKALRGAWQITGPANVMGTTGNFTARLTN